MRNLRNPQLGRGEVCIEDIELDLTFRGNYSDTPALAKLYRALEPDLKVGYLTISIC